MKQLKIDGLKGEKTISEECEVIIHNSKIKLSFDRNVKKIFISELIDSEIIFAVDHSMEIAMTNINTNSDSNLKYEVSNHESHLLVRNIAFTAGKTKLKQKILVTHESKRTFCDLKFLGFAFEESNLDVSANNWIKENKNGSESHQLLKVVTDGNAIARTEPGLIIDNYDVKASHGNSIGQFDKQELYFLQSRGLDKVQSKKLIIEGKIDDVLSSFDKEYSTKIKKIVVTQLEAKDE